MQTILRSTLLPAALISAALVVVVPIPGAHAQTTGSGQSEPTAIPDQKLDATAVAIQRVTSVRREYEQRLSTASGDDQKRIAEEGNTALSKAVTDQGLSLDEFNSIIRLAQNDPGVREKILQKMKPEGQ